MPNIPVFSTFIPPSVSMNGLEMVASASTRCAALISWRAINMVARNRSHEFRSFLLCAALRQGKGPLGRMSESRIARAIRQ